MFARARHTFVALLLLSLPALSALAVGEGRLQAEVVDEKGQPVAGVTVEITNADTGYRKEVTTNKKGRFDLIVIDATRVYEFRLAKEGHPVVLEPLKLDPGEVTKHTFTLPSQAAAASQAAPAAPMAGRGKAVQLYNEGVQALQKGDHAGALAKFEAATEADPAMPQGWSVLAGLHLDQKRYDEAVAAAEQLLAVAPEDPVALQVLYDSYAQTGQEEKAKQALERMMASAKGTDAAVRIFNAGADAAKAGNLDTALAMFEKAVEADPELAPGYAAAARLYLAKGEHQKAVDAAEKALAIDPALVDVQRVRYEGYRVLGREDEAKAVFEEMAANDPEGLADTLFERGREAFNAGSTAAAVQALEQALLAKPDHPRAHYMLGLAYANSGDNAKAKEHLKRFLELAPDDPEATTASEMLAYMG
jgi:tetratricopeptide (TPR) repeat protein